MPKKKLVWNVYEFAFGESKPCTVNVFDHFRFGKGLYKLKRKKLTNRDEFDKELQSLLMYSFWSKCEYELVLLPWPCGTDDKGHKIDVYNQIMINFGRFSDYVWENQKSIAKVV